MIRIERTNSKNKDFALLVQKLDAYLKIIDGDDHDFYNQFNGLETLKNVVLLYSDKTPVGCGAFKPFKDNSVEVKRMYVEPNHRGTKVAISILTALENFAKELGYKKCILETGKRQIEAVKFYKKSGYKIIPNYGQYKEMENSVCFEKTL